MAANKKQLIILFTTIYILEMIGGIYIGYFREAVVGDALSRTANAFYVFFIDPPRFASIGLVWNPLPSILQMTFVVFAKFWKPMVTHGIAAAIANCFFAAGGIIVIYKTFVKMKIEGKYSFPLLLLYFTNPFIFYYGFNGMSEGFTFFFMIYAVLSITLWLKEDTSKHIMKIAFALAMAFFCRYEAIPFAAAIGLGVLIIIFTSFHEKIYVPKTIKEKYYYAEGTAIVLYTPLLFSVFIWILFNWVISGNPLYFLNSAYSNTSQSEYAIVFASSWEAFSYLMKRIMPFIPLFGAIIVMRIINRQLFKPDFLVLAIMVLMMIAFHCAMLLKGSSYGWVRFFSYILPISMAWIPYEMSLMKIHRRKLACIIFSISLLLSWGLTQQVFADPLSDERTGFVTTDSRDIAEYVNDNLSEEVVLVDSFMFYNTILNLNDLSNIVTSSSPDFDESIEDPWKYGITCFLVPKPEGIGKLDAINAKYPELYDNGEEWCTEVMNFDGFKLFKIIY